MSISSQSRGKEVVALHHVDARLARCVRTGPDTPRLGIARIHVAEDHDKDYQRRAKQSICGVAAWVTGAAKSIGISISIPTGLLIFVEEALRPPGRLRDPGLCAVCLGMWGPEMGSLFWEIIGPPF